MQVFECRPETIDVIRELAHAGSQPGQSGIALSKIGVEVKEYDVVSVDLPNRPGELQKVARKLADAGINVMHMYGTSGQARTGTCIFVTSDNAQAIRLINRK